MNTTDTGEFTRIDRVRLLHLEIVEKYAERIEQLWRGTLDEIEDEKLIATIDKLTQYMQRLKDE